MSTLSACRMVLGSLRLGMLLVGVTALLIVLRGAAGPPVVELTVATPPSGERPALRFRNTSMRILRVVVHQLGEKGTPVSHQAISLLPWWGHTFHLSEPKHLLDDRLTPPDGLPERLPMRPVEIDLPTL